MRFSGGGGWCGGVCANEFVPQSTKKNRTAKSKGQRAKRSPSRENLFTTGLGSLLLALCVTLCLLWLSLLLINVNSDDAIAARNLIDDFHAANDAPKYGVATIEMRLRRMRNEPLRTTRVFSRQRHADSRPLVRHFINLATNCIARSAILITARVARLHDKIRHDARNRLAIEVTLL